MTSPSVDYAITAAVWKFIPNFPLYQITCDGTVRHSKTLKILKLNSNAKGYLRCEMYMNGKKCSRFVHRMVAETWIGDNPGELFVNHKDANKQNNHFSNLEWVTHAENMRHAVENNLIPKGNAHYWKLHPEMLALRRKGVRTKPVSEEGRANIRAARAKRSHLPGTGRKLSNEQAIEIRKRWAAGGVRQADLGEMFGVSQRAVWDVIHFKKYKQIETIPAGVA